MTDQPSPSWEFSRPNRFTAGAIGEPGARVFYVQVFAEGVEVDVKCEKQQVIALAEHMVKLLADLPDGGGAAADTDPVEALPPTDVAWIVGSISIGVDRAEDRIVVLLEEVVVVDDEDDEATMAPGTGSLRVHLTAEQVHGFAKQVAALASGSRPTCRLCGQPIDPDGHACPRLN